MGKRINLESDPKLAKSHEPGAVMELTQPVLHSQFGVVHYLSFQTYFFHLQMASDAFAKLEELQGEVLKLPIHSDNARLISDPVLLQNIYAAGFGVIINTYLAFDHFLFVSLMTIYRDDPCMLKILDEWDTLEKLNRFLNLVSKADLVSSLGYSKFCDIEKQRHGFNHLTLERFYNAKDHSWDEVPLAWIISGRYKEAYQGSMKLLSELRAVWDEERKKHDKPVVLTGVKRGIKSLHPAKKSKS